MSEEIIEETVTVAPTKKSKKAEVVTPLRWEGIQKMLRQQVGYPGKVDGFAGRLTISSLQILLRFRGFYEGDITGLESKATWVAVQDWLNEEYAAGLDVSGSLDAATEAALRLLNAELDA